MGPQIAEEIFVIYQPKKLLISLRWVEISWLHHVFVRDVYGRQVNWSDKRLAWSPVSLRYLGLLGIY